MVEIRIKDLITAPIVAGILNKNFGDKNLKFSSKKGDIVITGKTKGISTSLNLSEIFRKLKE